MYQEQEEEEVEVYYVDSDGEDDSTSGCIMFPVLMGISILALIIIFTILFPIIEWWSGCDYGAEYECTLVNEYKDNYNYIIEKLKTIK